MAIKYFRSQNNIQFSMAYLLQFFQCKVYFVINLFIVAELSNLSVVLQYESSPVKMPLNF